MNALDNEEPKPEQAPAEEAGAGSGLKLPSLRIENFRGIRELTIPKLGRVNLIVGKNGVGKSSLLEALKIYLSWASPRSISNVLHYHGEFSEKIMGDYLNEPKGSLAKIGKNIPVYQYDIKKIFNDGGESAKSTARICAGSPTEASAIVIGFRNEMLEVTRITSNSECMPRSIAASDLNLFLYDFSDEIDPEDVYENHVFIPPNGLSIWHTVRFWDKISLTGLEDKIILTLHAVNPHIDRLGIVGSPPDWSSRQFIAKLKGADRPVPLRSLGDGINRLLGLALALVKCRDGALLIDEIENGLHWSVQPQLWEVVFTLAEQLNIQVFATTHSYDCVEGFQQAATKHPGQGFLFRLEARNGSTRVVTYTDEELRIATRGDWEVR